MFEKIIKLENVTLVDFLGVENENINEIALAFPKTKIVSRGNEVRIKGNQPDLLKLNNLLNSLLYHYHKYGFVTNDNVKSIIHDNTASLENEEKDTLVYGNRGLKIAPKTKNQNQLVSLVNEKDIVFALGPAGTGKTYVSVALAVQALKLKKVKKIIITRPAVESGEHLGYLPGDLIDKLNPFLKPIYDALEDMIQRDRLKNYMEMGVIEIAPLAYMRGRTLDHSFILLDEAQNTTPIQMKMFLTRLGKHSKIIVSGDTSQVDLHENQQSGLKNSLSILQNLKGIGIVYLDENDVVRHALVKEIIKAYNSYDPKK